MTKEWKRIIAAILAAGLMISAVGCGQAESTEVVEKTEIDVVSELGLTAESKEASDYTIAINSAIYSVLDFDDTSEYENATRGLIDAPEVLELTNENGDVIWSQEAYAFLNDYETAPDTVNPSLWENTRNNCAYGLFQVSDKIYQVRGYDMANLTLIESDNGWIVFDPLMSVECTQAAMQLVEKNLGVRPIKAVIISHSHVDHYGGIKGIMSSEEIADKNLTFEQQLASGKIPVIVPEGFLEHAVSENLYAGNAMSRRASYQYGVLLEPGVNGKLAMGIGIGQSTGTITFLAPTYEITQSGETLVIDGVEMEFQLTPGTEAPAEMNTWFPELKALWMAENCSGTLHNLYTLRGAQVRDGAAWAKYITETISLYGAQADVVFQAHNWPHWGNNVINDYLVNTAAIYKFINDQTLTYINQGYTSDEISNMIELPQELEKVWYTRQYYGTVAHNSKAVYQKYMGWYDANPVNLNPLTPTESAQKWLEYLGDVDAVLKMAKEDYDAGNYQWVAEVTNTIVFADPENEAARLLCADALEQLGYQAESGPWRNAYLTAALELRNGNSYELAVQPVQSGDIPKEMTASMLFEYFSILLNKKAMADQNFTMSFNLVDVSEKYTLQIKNGVVLIYDNSYSSMADVQVTTQKNVLLYLMKGNMEAFQSAANIQGDVEKLRLFVSNLTELTSGTFTGFNMIEP